MHQSIVLETNLSGLTLARRGKVRDVYDLGEHLLIVATDRISAFDYILGSGIPDKGKVLTQLSDFWFGRVGDLVPHHLVSIDVTDFPAATRPHHAVLRGRSMLVRKTEPLPVECVARGFLSGSGWKDYQRTGAVCGIRLPAGLVESDRLPEPLFTPATKAESGHDLNISEAEAGEIVGRDLIGRLRDLTLAIYGRGVAHGETCGIIIADTKFEFGLARRSVGQPSSSRRSAVGADLSRRSAVGAKADEFPAEAEADLILIDEILTPDSSRFWPKADYRPGRSQPSFDKQFVRDYLEQIGWNKQPPVPSLPDEVVSRTRDKYIEAFRRITGAELVV
jgi:phosphoribosylaminoimidazole-succinocarboxamide synthase